MNLKEKVKKMVMISQKLQFTNEGMETLYKLINYYELKKESPEMFMGCIFKSAFELDSDEKSSMIGELVELANELLDDGQKKSFKQLLTEQNIEVQICCICKSIVAEGDCIKENERFYCTKECSDKGFADFKQIISVAHDLFSEEGIKRFLELIKVTDEEFIKSCITEPPVDRDDLDRSQEASRVVDLVEIANELLDDSQKVELNDICSCDDVEVRICSVCNDLMYEGYCIDGGSAYYCTDECRNTEMTQEEFEELFDDGDGDTYWTQWI